MEKDLDKKIAKKAISGIALVTTFTASLVLKEMLKKVANIEEPVSMIFESDMDYNPTCTEEDGRYMIGEGTFVSANKDFFDEKTNDYYKINGICDTGVYSDQGYLFNTEEFNQTEELYIPKDNIRTFTKIKVKTVNPDSESVNIRTSPEKSKNNIVGKLTNGTTIFIEDGFVKENNKYIWKQVLIEDENKQIIKGGYIVIDKSKDDIKFSVCMYTDENESNVYAYVTNKTYLFGKDELDEMYYRVIPFTGSIMYSDENRSDFKYIPHDALVKSTASARKLSATDIGDDLYIKGTVITKDNEELEGYIAYRIGGEYVLNRIPKEQILNEKKLVK